MTTEKIEFKSIGHAVSVLDAIGSGNSPMMATRAIHINVLLKNIPGSTARLLKGAYNDIGAEAAISSAAYHDRNDVPTDMVVMGTVYQHREVRRILKDDRRVSALIDEIGQIVENAPETSLV